MFDRLIECETDGKRSNDRSRYFTASALCVGLILASAFIFSLYAADFRLGGDSLEISTLLAPVDPAPIAPEIAPKDTKPMAAAPLRSEIPSRRVNMSRTDEPTVVLQSTSIVRNNYISRPDTGRFKLGIGDSGPATGSGPARGEGVRGRTSEGEGLVASAGKAEVKAETPPPPIKVVEPRPSGPRSLGVINGKASHLPRPAYPAAAISMNAQGKVDVQVVIDESGKVISAKAISGHPILKQAALRSAWAARFTPTLLSNVPVKVTGVIVYHFTR